MYPSSVGIKLDGCFSQICLQLHNYINTNMGLSLKKQVILAVYIIYIYTYILCVVDIGVLISALYTIDLF